MLNLTVDVLGASINVLETAARFEGVEILIEQFFGDEGYFPDDRIMKMFNLKPYEERDKEERTVNKVLRRQRSLSIEDDINRVENHLHKLHRTVSLRKSFPKCNIFPLNGRLCRFFRDCIKITNVTIGVVEPLCSGFS